MGLVLPGEDALIRIGLEPAEAAERAGIQDGWVGEEKIYEILNI